jgi:catechol 2,3-dioxygenase-like lactoylglutathione lyase family enzyme
MAKIKVRKVNHVAVAVKDRRASLKFYRDLLGLEVIPSMVESPNIVWMRMADGTMLHLIEPREGTPPPAAPAGAYHTAFEVDDFDGAYRALQEAGLEIEPPHERLDGQRAMFIRDPDGNRVEIATRSGLKPAKRVADELGYTRNA